MKYWVYLYSIPLKNTTIHGINKAMDRKNIIRNLRDVVF